MADLSSSRAVIDCSAWPALADPAQWPLYRRVLDGARDAGIEYAVGGGVATMAYTGQWRDAKDLDVYIACGNRDHMVEIYTKAGLEDYYDKQPYDRDWIYRGFHDGVIVDLIWSMANKRAGVDSAWLQRGRPARADGISFLLVPPEETLWNKLYVMQRDRCDWPDALNLLHDVAQDIEWSYLLSRVDEDKPLLGGLLSIFAWICPDRAAGIPGWVWEAVSVLPPQKNGCEEIAKHRARLLDSRPWFHTAES